MIKIEKGINPPTPPNAKYPFSEMVVGDSFFVTMDYALKIRAAAHAAKRNAGCNGFNFMTRTVTENDIRGVRVWRIK